MAETHLLGSSPTLEKLHAGIGRYYCGMETSLVETGPDLWAVRRDCDGKILDSVRVIKRKARYRFEGVAP
jgi:hypothetical protein